MDFFILFGFFGFIILLCEVIRIRLMLQDISGLLVAEGQARYLEFYTINELGEKIKLGGTMFLKISDKLPLSLEIKDKFGNPAAVDGAPQWAVSDPSLANLEVAEGGMSAMLVPTGIVGSFSVQVMADADLGEGVKELLGELQIELLGGEAVSIAISAGAAIPQDEPPAA